MNGQGGKFIKEQSGDWVQTEGTQPAHGGVPKPVDLLAKPVELVQPDTAAPGHKKGERL